MSISYCVCLKCRGRVVTNVVRTCDPTPLLYIFGNKICLNYRYQKIRNAFSKFYHRHSGLIIKYNIGLKSLLLQGILEPVFYGDLVNKFKRIVRKPYLSDQFKKIIKR